MNLRHPVRKKTTLTEGETWEINNLEPPLLGYGITTYEARRINPGTDATIRFFAPESVSVNVGDRLVVFESWSDAYWLNARVVKANWPLDNFVIQVVENTSE